MRSLTRGLKHPPQGALCYISGIRNELTRFPIVVKGGLVLQCAVNVHVHMNDPEREAPERLISSPTVTSVTL